MRNSCEEEFTDEVSRLKQQIYVTLHPDIFFTPSDSQYSPVYHYKSAKVDIALELSDSFTVRNDITTQLYSYAKTWLTNAISRAPIELQTILQVS